MSNIARAADIMTEMHHHLGGDQGWDPRVVSHALADAGLLTPAPQIIRTVAELKALDPDTLVEKPGTVTRAARQAINVAGHWGVGAVLPAVKVAEGAHVRACREALEGVERG